MINFTSLARATACAAVLIAGGMTTVPGIAAPADVEFLQTFVGNWRGRGVLTGASKETVVCKLGMTEGNQDKVNYSARCSLAGTTLSMNGTVAYIESSKRFEAAMTSNVSFSSKAVGRKQGNAIVFTLNDTGKDEEGNNLKFTSQMVLSGKTINVEFQVVFANGDKIAARVPFTKS
jgi:hypothetical protein